ncbi:MAG: hypothetical protein P8M03_04630 [Flavobacteriaceae bacterium]|nr:hypothetical protein [Flavobacteriaceae bacterium]
MKNIFSFPLILIGISMIILGILWMIVDEPWMLDKVANEERLGINFKELFKIDTNSSLPQYLKQIYRFFGLWVLIIGLFTTTLSSAIISKDSKIRIILLLCIGLMSYCGIILAYIWIPSSPFVYLGWIMIILHAISFYAHNKL